MRIDNKYNIVIDGETDYELIHGVWNKAKIRHSHNAYKVRFDKYGSKMHYKEYCNMNSKYGWFILFSTVKKYKKSAFTIPVNINNLNKLEKIYKN